MSAESCSFAIKRNLLVPSPALDQLLAEYRFTTANLPGHRVSLYDRKPAGSQAPTITSQPLHHEHVKGDTLQELRDLLHIAKLNIDKPDQQTLRGILRLVYHQPANQSAAGAAGAVSLMHCTALSRNFSEHSRAVSLNSVLSKSLKFGAARREAQANAEGNDVFSFHSTACDDVFTSVPTRVTRQIGDTCFAFAAARSFNCR
jgi:hypothetical protein